MDQIDVNPHDSPAALNDTGYCLIATTPGASATVYDATGKFTPYTGWWDSIPALIDILSSWNIGAAATPLQYGFVPSSVILAPGAQLLSQGGPADAFVMTALGIRFTISAQPGQLLTAPWSLDIVVNWATWLQAVGRVTTLNVACPAGPAIVTMVFGVPTTVDSAYLARGRNGLGNVPALSIYGSGYPQMIAAPTNMVNCAGAQLKAVTIDGARNTILATVLNRMRLQARANL